MEYKHSTVKCNICGYNGPVYDNNNKIIHITNHKVEYCKICNKYTYYNNGFHTCKKNACNIPRVSCDICKICYNTKTDHNIVHNDITGVINNELLFTSIDLSETSKQSVPAIILLIDRP